MSRTRMIPIDQLEPFALRGELFALLDACDEPSVPKRCLNEYEAPAYSLYRGKSQEHYWHIAPYLATITPKDLKWIARDLWQSPWGAFVISRAGIYPLYNHFRRFLQVKGPDGNQYLFRFYDPRVLRAFLRSSTPREIYSFYGPVSLFGIASAEGTYNVDVLWP